MTQVEKSTRIAQTDRTESQSFQDFPLI